MSQAPPTNHIAEPTDAQLKVAKRIAAKTGKTVEQVLAQAIARGTSAAFADVLAGRAPAAQRG
ncbi:hypothetical protein [Delftia acidovorans]|uniref:Uncharacterized protein n=1 Tax=Delftia acidovorans TaxID=80866 RepID=A0AAJ2VCG6_DELAC|nr:hypothetical protein [Delftia acidovorans]MDX4957256.1 hypothetical protein [Delftia acidovorans]